MMKAVIEVPPPSRSWLDPLPADAQAVAEALFIAAVEAGMKQPRDICRHVAVALRELDQKAKARGDARETERLLVIWRRLMDADQAALAFAVAIQAEAKPPMAKPAAKVSRLYSAHRVDALGDPAAQWSAEEEFEEALAAHFQRAGCIVHRQVAANVADYSGDKSSGLRRPDLHVQRPAGMGWPAVFAIELKLDKGTGEIRQGAKQAIAYVGAFDWREGGGRLDERRLPAPAMCFFTSPKILGSGWGDGRDWHYLERDLWDNGCALLTWHRNGEHSGVEFRYLERSYTLTGKCRWQR